MPTNTNTFSTTTQPNLFSIFPKSLDSSGYVILSTIAITFILFFLIQALLFRKLLVSLQEGHETLKNVSFSLYIQQQIMEYRLLLADLNYSQSAIEKANARTQLYNHLNTVCLEICETNNKYLASQLAKIFFSKIKSRYLKLASVPDGIIYFKYISGVLLHYPTESIETNLQRIRKSFKKEIKLQQEIQREVIQNPSVESKKQGWFPSFKKKDKKN